MLNVKRDNHHFRKLLQDDHGIGREPTFPRSRPETRKDGMEPEFGIVLFQFGEQSGSTRHGLFKFGFVQVHAGNIQCSLGHRVSDRLFSGEKTAGGAGGNSVQPIPCNLHLQSGHMALFYEIDSTEWCFFGEYICHNCILS